MKEVITNFFESYAIYFLETQYQLQTTSSTIDLSYWTKKVTFSLKDHSRSQCIYLIWC